MTPVEAKQILNCTSNDEEIVIDAFEKEVFDLIRIFLNDPVIPKIVMGRMEKLKVLEEAKQELVKKKYSEIKDTFLISDLDWTEEWNSFFDIYEKNKAKIRKQLASVYDGDRLQLLLENLIENEMKYARRLVDRLKNLPLIGVKSSENVPLIEVKNELNKLLEQGIIDNSMASLVNINANMDIFNLSKEVNRLRKLIE